MKTDLNKQPPRDRTASRRRFLQTAGGVGAITLLDAIVPAWSTTMRVLGAQHGPAAEPLVFDLAIRQRRAEIAGGSGDVIAVNNTVPGPLLEWYEGEDVVIYVRNELNVDTSIHWHGILLPFEMDGVPGVGFPGIKPAETFQYRFPVRQSGTYWYHSHSQLQEQSGHYGPLVVHPRDPDPVSCDRDYVVVLSDWTFDDPHKVMHTLKKMSDYYNFQKVTVADIMDEPAGAARHNAVRTKLAWDRMRMMPSDIADIGGTTYSYLMNGLHPAGNWTGLFQPGERVRLRFINASAMTYFNVRIPGLEMQVVAADGQNIQPVTSDEFQFGPAETYDIVVAPQTNHAYTIMAETIDRSGFAAGTLAPRAGMRAEIPPLRKPPKLSMVDMGMDHAAMAGHRESMVGNTGATLPVADGIQHGGADHAAMGHGGPVDAVVRTGHGMHSAGPVIARHGPDEHGAGNAGIANLQRDRLGERGTGLTDVPHRVLVYTDLKRLDHDFDARPPTREIELHLTGHMERYMWSFDGVQFHEVDGPIEFHHGERLRLTLVNDTMMNHPIHLHGMWLELENGHGRHIPRKHTINIMPAARVSALISADAPGRWAFHCHLLYHMEMGMFRVVRVS
ncbi:MAG: copper resistance system multicopper oxidase [Woeseia sp.]|nr:copper resistance system multicopper oxidase [Woeseia sp.]MBT8095642.1 copper resistance system multicopper oxidase [Woeseia sp.]NNE61522.1 copper resistance system multicopper oxidase [Woeseia sp.]NNL54118.1 copper resistance system multicopper oxidase [Woeseia sp.]